MAQLEEVKLPKGWVGGTASDLVLNPKNDIVDGPFGSNLKASEYTDSGTPIVRIQNVKRFRFVDKNIHFVTDEKAEQLKRHSFKGGDVLITKLGEPLGLTCIAPVKYEFGIIVADIVRARPYIEISNKFMTYLLNSRVVIEQISKHTKGSTRSRINLSVVRNLNIPIPPLVEQKRIVEKLDSLLAQVDTIQQRLNNLPDIIKRFRQSVLAAAVSGKLTEQWREKNDEVFDDWSVKELGQLASDVSYGYTASSSPENVGPQMVRITDIQGGNVAWDKVPYCQIAEDKVDKYLLAENDLLFARTGATVGKSFLIKEKPPRSVYASYLIRVRCKDSSLINYLSKFFNSQHYWSQITEFSSGIGQPSVNGTKLKKLKIPLPSLAEQSEIVRLVEQYFALADTLEKNLANAKQRVDNLTQSILAKAFKGELVPQDPNDEPADKLLERIKAARLEADALEKAAKKVAKAKTTKSKSVKTSSVKKKASE